ncbi:hypothetical protein NA56DRAFT_690279 [Hyaloscypha hepaticicola]|uniref:Chromo domain-containing protein n=1 Tax=Hyaloscypha hepaticicola TaxID=2082293 RepID=A0A2J6Q045_9HELO|nr:hypothetical protein NA56DRAFT_690279 [Hyaloscypha hepaticicola]
MFPNTFTDRSRPGGGKRRCKQHLTFDFVVAERPMYVPGSGPPLAPVTVMPAHDKDGIIQGEVKMDKKLKYIVGYERHPYLRVSVKPQNILDWVSPRTLEDWEFEKTKAEYQADEDELLPKILAREQRKKLKELGGKASRASDGPKKTWSRKRKRPPTPEPPFSSVSGRKQRGVDTDDEEAHRISLRRPSLSTPVKQRGLAEVLNLEDSEEEEDSFAEDAAELIDRQLNGTPSGKSKLRVELSRSPATSPDPQPVKSKKPPGFARRETKSGSISSATGARGRETRSSSSSRPPSRRDSVAATSSRQARAIYEKLELLSQAKAGSLADKYAYSGKPPTSSQRQAAANASTGDKSETPKHKKSATPEPAEDDDAEYEVDAILDDVYRKDKKGKLGLWYLIKWVGEWDNTWEPAENVGAEAIAEYEAKKTAEEKRNLDIAFDTTTSYSEDIINVDHKGKDKQKKKSKVEIDDAASLSSKDMELRAKGKRRVPFGSGGRDIEVREKGKMKVPFGSGGIDLTGDSSEEESDQDSLFVNDKSPEKLVLKKAPPKTMRRQVIDDASASGGS